MLNNTRKDIDNMRIEVEERIKSLAAVTDENSASTREISATVQQQAAFMEKIKKDSEDMELLAKHLHKLVRNFKI